MPVPPVLTAPVGLVLGDHDEPFVGPVVGCMPYLVVGRGGVCQHMHGTAECVRGELAVDARGIELVTGHRHRA